MIPPTRFMSYAAHPSSPLAVRRFTPLRNAVCSHLSLVLQPHRCPEPTPTRRRLGDPLESDSHIPNWPSVRWQGSVGGDRRPQGGLQAIQRESLEETDQERSTFRATTDLKLPRLRSLRIEDADCERWYPTMLVGCGTAGPVPGLIPPPILARPASRLTAGCAVMLGEWDTRL
ncbi:hypothetical protein DFH06DRAFT_1176010, partial [Mycena polygramma]